MPGRPVLLTEFCRGFDFTAIGVQEQEAKNKKVNFLIAAVNYVYMGNRK